MNEVLYTNCDLPQHLFERATVTGDMSFIVLEPGDVDEEARQSAWLAINDEYLQIIGDTTSIAYSADLTNHAVVGSKVIVVQALLAMAANTPVDGVLVHLRELYPEMAFPVDDAEQLQDDLDRVALMLERDAMDYELLSKKIEQEENTAPVEQSRPTQETFDQIKIAINDHKKMVYDFTKLTTRQYALLVKSLRDIKTQEPQAV